MTDLDRYRATARAWIEANLEPMSPVEKDRRYLSEAYMDEGRVIQRRLFDAGYAGIDFPVEYGGQGRSAAHDRAFREEAANFRLPELGGVGIATFGPIAHSMLAHCTPEFLARRIPPILRGEELWCQFYSEPDAGSDLAGIRTRATRMGDSWVLNGSKIWTTGAAHAAYAMCLARTAWDVPKHRGLTWFAVPTRAPGLTIVPVRQIAAGRTFYQEYLEDVVVGEDAVIGEVNDGWSVTHTMLMHERGAGELGAPIVEPADLAPDLVETARSQGRLDDPVVRQSIARAHIDDYARYELSKWTVARLRAGGANPSIAAYNKLAGAVLDPVRARIALEIAGAAALLWPPTAADLPHPTVNYLNARRMAIAAGTSEMQRSAIGEQVLGLPREPSFDSRKPFNEVLRDAQTWDGRVS